MPEPTLEHNDSVFGTVVTPLDVEGAIQSTLELWLPTYLRFAERRAGKRVGSYPDVASWRSADTMEERFPEQQIPAVQIMMTENVDLVTHGTGASGVFDGTIDVLVASSEPEAARANASTYGFFMGLLLAQQSGLDGSIPISGLGWEKVGTPAVGKPDGRWLALGSIAVNVTVESVFESLSGPGAPDLETPEIFPSVEKTHVSLNGTPLLPDIDLFPSEDLFPEGN